MNHKPTRNGFIFWVASPSGNLDQTSKSILSEIVCFDAFEWRARAFRSARCLIKKNIFWIQKKYFQPTIEIYVCSFFFWYQCFILFDPEYVFNPSLVTWVSMVNTEDFSAVAPRELGDTTSQMPGIEPTDPGFAKPTDGPTQIRWPVAPQKKRKPWRTGCGQPFPQNARIIAIHCYVYACVMPTLELRNMGD